MKTIRINGYVLNKSVMVEDPDVKRTFEDLSGQKRHVRIFSDPARLKSYIKKHPEGMILAGVGVFFFEEPVVVTTGSFKFGEDGSVDILVRAGAEDLERQLKAIEAISCEAQVETASILSDQRS